MLLKEEICIKFLVKLILELEITNGRYITKNCVLKLLKKWETELKNSTHISNLQLLVTIARILSGQYNFVNSI